jgi:hypothetical protein
LDNNRYLGRGIILCRHPGGERQRKEERVSEHVLSGALRLRLIPKLAAGVKLDEPLPPKMLRLLQSSNTTDPFFQFKVHSITHDP